VGGCRSRVAELRQDARLRMLEPHTGGRLFEPVAAGSARDCEFSWNRALGLSIGARALA
jgi:hypothetical protein